MNDKITDAEIAQYVSGELSGEKADIIRKTAEVDSDISIKINKMTELDSIFEEEAIKNFPIPSKFFNEVKRELNLMPLENKAKNKTSSLFLFFKFMTTGFGGGAIAGSLVIFLILFQSSQMVFRSIEDKSLKELDNKKNEDSLNLLSGIDYNDGWNIYKSLMFRVENKQQNKSLLNGSNITVGDEVLINLVFFKDKNRVTMSFNDLDLKDFKTYNKGDKDIIEKIIRSVDDNIFKFSIESKWFEDNDDKKLNFEKYSFKLNILKP